MKEEVYLSVIIPAYNEAKRIMLTLESIMAYLREKDYTSEILVVDDGSTDETVKVVKRITDESIDIRMITNKENHGKGFVVRQGMTRARGLFRIFMDADNSTNISEVEKFWPCVKKGYDVVIGSRAVKGSEIVIHQPWYREMPGRIANKMIRRMTGLPFKDTQCGFKLFSKKVALEVFSKCEIDRWAFDVEVLVLARRLGFKVKEVGIGWKNDRASRVSIKSYFETLWEVLKIIKR